MILVDKNIKELISQDKLIIEGYKEENVKNSSYDLVLDKIIKSSDIIENEANICKSYKIPSGHFVYIKMKEKVHIPNNILGRIEQKNSIMRLGLVVDGPNYQPGHKTNIYLRVQNISPNEIKIHQGQILAQMIFEELKDVPERPYNEDNTASFNDEFEYSGFAKYEGKYKSIINKMEKTQEKLENMENRIYGNILTFMGIFISIFSVININFQFFSSNQLSLNEMIRYATVINLSLLLVLAVLFNSIFYVTNKKHSNRKYIANVCVPIILLVVLNIILIQNTQIKYEVANNQVKAESIDQSSENIIKLQELLKQNNYNVEVNGILDDITIDAINSLKKKDNLDTCLVTELIIHLSSSNTKVSN